MTMSEKKFGAAEAVEWVLENMSKNPRKTGRVLFYVGLGILVSGFLYNSGGRITDIIFGSKSEPVPSAVFATTTVVTAISGGVAIGRDNFGSVTTMINNEYPQPVLSSKIASSSREVSPKLFSTRFYVRIDYTVGMGYGRDAAPFMRRVHWVAPIDNCEILKEPVPNFQAPLGGIGDNYLQFYVECFSEIPLSDNVTIKYIVFI